MWGLKRSTSRGKSALLLKRSDHKNYGAYIIAWGDAQLLSTMLNPSSHRNVQPASIGLIPKIFDGIFIRVGFGLQSESIARVSITGGSRPFESAFFGGAGEDLRGRPIQAPICRGRLGLFCR